MLYDVAVNQSLSLHHVIISDSNITEEQTKKNSMFQTVRYV